MMRNCIGTYRGSAVKGTAEYGAIHKDGKVLANFEVKNKELSQLLGTANSRLDPEVCATLEAFFEAFEINVEHYWGKPVKPGKYDFQVAPAHDEVNPNNLPF